MGHDFEPQGAPFRTFDFPVNLSLAPSTYTNFAVTDLFYWCNWMHDQLYDLGFDEASGNYQKDNFGRGGLEGDPLLADAQDGSGVNNANYTPTADGVSPRIQMFIFDGPDPDQDGGLDADIILHEYTHGLTDRLIGGGVGLSALQAVGMAEGWSDFYALCLLAEPGDDIDGTYPVGGYSTWQFRGLSENYYYGIRRYPYTTDMSRDPLTFKDIDPAQISSHAGVPRNPVWPFDVKEASQVHRQGEVWCAMLWEMRANLVRKHGFEAGNRLTLQLVTDGLRLSPPNPTFVQARNAILLADRVWTDGANQFEIWSGFTKRGMGVNASAPSNGTTSGVVESFDLPDLISIQPLAALDFTGTPGGPVAPTCRTLTLTNHGTVPVPFAARADQDWIDLHPTAGTLPAGGATNLSVCLNDQTASLPGGLLLGSITVTNLNRGGIQSRQVRLRLVPSATVPFFEGFESGLLSSYWVSSGSGFPDLTLSTNLTPRSGRYHAILASGYDGVATRNELTLSADLTGFTNVTLGFSTKSFHDQPQPPPAGPFQDGADFDGVAVSDNGVDWYPVGGYPSGLGGWTEVVMDIDAARARWGLAYGPSFRVRFNQYGRLSPPNDGRAFDDIVLGGFAPRRFSIEFSGLLVEGGEPGAATARVFLPVPVSAPVTLRLQAEPASELLVPPTVTLPAGAREVIVPLTPVDDNLLDGSQAVTLTVQADGYIGLARHVLVRDNESAVLTLEAPASVREGSGFLEEAGWIYLDRPPAADIVVQVTSDRPNSVFAGPSVLVPAGATNAPFHMQVFDDDAINGLRTVLLQANVAGWVGDQLTLLLEDNESTNVFVTGPASLHESDVTLSSTLRVGISGTLTTNLLVSLASSDPTRISVPESVLLPVGTKLASLPLTVYEDERLNDSDRFVFISASAPAFGSGTLFILIYDDEAAPIPHRPQPPDRATGVPVTTTLGWNIGVDDLVRNGGFESGTFSGWIVRSSENGGFQIDDGSTDPLGPGEPSAPLDGQFSALVAQAGPGRNELLQDLVLPAFADRIWLTWSHRVHNHAGAYATNQGFRVEIQDPGGNVLQTAFTTNPGDPSLLDWSQHSFEVSAYKGRVIRLAFIEEDSEGFLNAQVDNVQVFLDYEEPAAYEVYFGETAKLGPEHFRGLTAERSWKLPRLDLDRTYWWRIVAKRGGSAQAGPVWQFHTRTTGQLDHFVWDSITPDQVLDVPFPVTLTARDDLGNVLSNYFGSVRLEATRQLESDPVQVLTFTSYADLNGTYRHVKGAIFSHFTNLVETTFTGEDASILRSQLVGKDVFMVVEQRFVPAGKMDDLGSAWALVLSEFAERGGVVVVQSYSKDEHLLLQNSGLMDLTKIGNDLQKQIVTQGSSPVLEGVDPAFTGWHIASYQTPTNAQTLMVTGSNTVAAAAPLGEGLVVMIGTDFATNRTGLDRLLANVIQWPRRASLTSIDLSPQRSGFFLNGRWDGSLTLHETGEDILLGAMSTEGPKGVSPLVRVRTDNDLSLVVTDDPDPAPIGEPVRFEFIVASSGPDPVTAVTLTNRFSPAMRFVAIQSSQGSCVVNGSVIACDLGTIDPFQPATLSLTLLPVDGGYLTNQAEIFRPDEDPFGGNNRVLTFTRVNYASLSAGAATVTEGNGTGLVAEIPVGLYPANELDVRVEFVTTNTTATPGVDFVTTAGALLFPPGSTNQFIRVPILADQLSESPEAFLIHLFNPVRAVILDSQGSCLILDDDPTPVLTLDAATVIEGPEEGVTNAVFHLRLSRPSGEMVSVLAATEDITATGGRDYLPVQTTLIVPAGATNATLTVPVFGDLLLESNETFRVRLSAVQGGTLGQTEAIGQIVDDDDSQLDHFEWSLVPSPQFYNEPIPVSVSAHDSRGELLTGFSGQVALSAFAQPEERLIDGANGSWEFPLGTEFHDARVQSIYLPSEMGGPSRLTRLSLNVTGLPGQRLNHLTIRLKYADQGQYHQPSWEQSDWQTVYQRNTAILDGGWIDFDFSPAFDYDGLRPLLVDFSFNNGTYSQGGMVQFSQTDKPRSLAFRTDGGYGDPLEWSGPDVPPPQVSTRVPRIRFRTERPVQVSPEVAGPFTNGQWSGEIVVEEVPGLMQVRASDEQGHAGDTDPFSVSALDDVALLVEVAPVPISFGGPVTYLLTITNTGPSTATGVALGNILAPGLELLSVQASQGQSFSEGGLIFCEVGTIPGDAAVLVEIEAISHSLGLVTNVAAILRSEEEVYTNNNRVVTVTPVRPPTLIIDDVTIAEGDAGTNDALFVVSLSNPTDALVSLPYMTSGRTASNGVDFVAVEGVLLLPPGTTNGVVPVPVLGDLRNENEEFFLLNFGLPTNAVLVLEEAVGTIVDNDPVPLIQIQDMTYNEGDTGEAGVQLLVSLSQPSGKIVRVFYQTAPQTASFDSDYRTGGGLLFYPPGLTNRTIFLSLIGDTEVEPDETFRVVLTGPVEAELERDAALITIRNDDGLPGVLDHFDWSLFDPVQVAGQPFQAMVAARDYFGDTVTNFNDFVRLTGREGGLDQAVGTGTRDWNIPFGTGHHDARAQCIFLASEVGGPNLIRGLAFNFLRTPGQRMHQFTLRLKHTPLDRFFSSTWETNAWQTVYVADQDVPDEGWHAFMFQTPFEFNGTNHLMLDISFNNHYFTTDGFIEATFTNTTRSVAAKFDSTFGDPLGWSGAGNPPGTTSGLMPNTRFIMGADVPTEPDFSVLFANGLWTGPLEIQTPSTDLRMLALDLFGRHGFSQPFTVFPSADDDEDGDGLPDAWEWIWFGGVDAPGGGPDEDPDGDGALNLDEYRAGTDPTDPDSAFLVTSVHLSGTDVVLTFNTSAGLRYQVERTSNLALDTWIAVGGEILGDGTPATAIDPGATLAGPSIYRIRLLTSP